MREGRMQIFCRNWERILRRMWAPKPAPAALNGTPLPLLPPLFLMPCCCCWPLQMLLSLSLQDGASL